MRFASVEGGEQTATLRRVEGAQAAETGGGGKVIVEGVPVSAGHEGHVTQAGDHRFFAGWRSDPFFFDVLGTCNKFQFTSGDFFADKDTCSIVLQVPNSLLGPSEVGLWARTLIPTDGAGGTWIQAMALNNRLWGGFHASAANSSSWAFVSPNPRFRNTCEGLARASAQTWGTFLHNH